MRAFRLTGLLILVFSLVYSALSGDWPSGHSVFVWAVAGVVGGVAGGVALRATVPRQQRRNFIRKTYPRIGARLPPTPEDDSE